MEAAQLQDWYTEEEDSGNEEEDFYYGYRTIISHDEKGGEIYSCRALTPDDLLDPEEGDVYMQGSLHTDDVEKLRSIFRHHLRNRKNIKVYSDLKIIWDSRGKKNPAPDISIFENVKDPEKPRASFSVEEEGASPFFVLEVVSPRYRRVDIFKKPEIYRRAGVSEYFIVDPGLEADKISYTVQGYRLSGNRYMIINPDEQGRVYSQTADVWIGASESGDQIMVWDGQTDEPVLSDSERAEQEKEKAEQERIRAEQEKEKAEQERIRAEQEKARADSLAEELRQLKEKLESTGIPA
ncbi:MAG: Uma2 family endonuclease [Desulfobacterales bacterium]